VKKIGIIIGLISIALSARSQDIHFSQISQTPLLLNPASAGIFDGFYRATLNYKNQWAAIGKPYQTFMGSFDMPFESRKHPERAYIGLGTYIFSDKAGDSRFSTTQGSIAVSGTVPIGTFNKLSAGIETGLMHRSLNINAIQWPNQYNGSAYDPTLPSNESNKLGSFLLFDVGAGFHFQYLKQLGRFHGRDVVHYTFGAAIFHTINMIKGNSAYIQKMYPRLSVHTSLRYDLKGTRIGLIPSALFMRQGPAYEIDLGMLVRFRLGKETNFTGYYTESSFTAGVLYRYKDAITPQVFFEIANFGVGLSYDINISSLRSATRYNGGLEVSIKYSKLKGALYKNWK
jgi:type IX secretion system PorP/SprF family membrane protein